MKMGEILFKVVFSLHGLLKNIVSDWEVQFTSQIYQEFCNRLKMTKFIFRLSSQLNEQMERLNQEPGIFRHTYYFNNQHD